MNTLREIVETAVGIHPHRPAHIPSGSVFNNLMEIDYREDSMWDRMYVRPRPVIIVCGYCKSHNAISNPTCVQCGAAMGYGTER